MQKHWRVAILDMYEGVPNEGMRCIRDIVHHYANAHQLQLQLDEFEVRMDGQMADLSYDLYISTGGPGSPVDSEGSEWERKFFKLMQDIENWNRTQELKKHVFLICHSYQIYCRYHNLGEVCLRKSPAFGVFPVHKTEAGQAEPVFAQLHDPFYIVDSRNWQVIGINQEKIKAMGAQVLAIEKERPHVPLERATMAIRFNDYCIGTQFHPEADAAGMLKYLKKDQKKLQVIAAHGDEKYHSMVDQLNDPDKILYTHDHLLPAFFQQAATLVES